MQVDSELYLARCVFKSSVSKFRLRAESVAWAKPENSYGSASLYLLSAVGSDTVVKAVRAILLEPNVECKIGVSPSPEEKYRMNKCAGGYVCRTAKLSGGLVHLVATAKMDGFLPDISEPALWLELTSDRYTTPLLRHWCGPLKEKLLALHGLIPCEGVNTTAGVLVASPEGLDKLVSELVRRGELTLTQE